MNPLSSACIAAYEQLTAWADLLDRINVFPVADGDTGMNLRISLAPLRDCGTDMATVLSRLAGSGRGNSGNIAVPFLCEFLALDGQALAAQAKIGRDKAWGAIAKPCSGTMLGVFDALCVVLDEQRGGNLDCLRIREQLQEAVLATELQLPELADAGVVDSGALGMFVFFDGFFQELCGQKTDISPVTALFPDKLRIKATFQPQAPGEYCVEAVLATDAKPSDLLDRIADFGNSAVLVPDSSGVKVHLHTRNPEQLRKDLSSLGDVVNWSDEAMDPMIRVGASDEFQGNSVRIMTDAAGSIPLALARDYRIVLLDSYILAADQARPESLFTPEQLYQLMKEGVKVTTAQASNHERHLHYQAACEQYGKVLYLSTGSAFTGNFSCIMDWKKAHDPDGQLEAIDSGAASGRLAVIALLAARLAGQGAAVAEVIASAEDLSKLVEEYVFLHELKYLVAGGRVSRSKGFFADLLHMKPVISPGFEGVRKVAVLRNREAQLDFACAQLASQKGNGSDLLVLLQYSDNKEWLTQVVESRIRNQIPNAEILLVPLSLSSGVHMGPGTWSIAFGSSTESV